MASSEVGSGQVAIVPTFKGFRKAVAKETDTAAKDSDKGFRRAFSKTGSESGKQTGRGFKKAFESESKGFSAKATRDLERDVAKAARALSQARLKQLDQVGKVRVAEAQLAEAQSKYASGSSQVVRALERLQSETRKLETANENTAEATQELRSAQERLADSSGHAERAGRNWATRLGSSFKSKLSDVFKGAFFGSLLGNIAANLANRIGQAIGNGLRDGIQMVIGSVDLASQFEQSVGAVDAIFGESSATIHRWAESAAEDVGLSKNSFNELATVVGAQLKNLGIPMDEVTGTTGELVQLGADLAAQFGGPTSEAVAAISSLLRGERDPIERYGVSMNEAAVKAEAFALGLVTVTKDADKIAAAQARAEVAQRKYNDAVRRYGKDSTPALTAYASMTSANSSLEKALEGSTEELTNAQKAQATLSLLYKQTADAQGTFARETDTLAGKQQRLNAQWENAQIKIGEAFMPIASKLVDLLSDDLLPIIEDLVDKHGPGLAKAFEDALPALGEFAEDLLPQLPGLLDTIISTLPDLVEILPGFIEFLKGVNDAGSGTVQMLGLFFDIVQGNLPSLDELNERIEKMPGFWGGMYQSIVDTVTGLGAWLGTGIWHVRNFAERVGAWIGTAKWHIEQFAADVYSNGQRVIGFFRDLPTTIGRTVQNIGSWLYNSGKELIQGFINGIRDQFPWAADAVSGLLDWLRGFFPNSPAKRGPLSGAGWTRLRKSGSAVVEQFTSGFGRPDVSAALAPLLLPAVEAAPSRSAVGSMSPSKHVTNNVTLVNPVVRDPQREAWEAAQIIGSVA